MNELFARFGYKTKTKKKEKLGRWDHKNRKVREKASRTWCLCVRTASSPMFTSQHSFTRRIWFFTNKPLLFLPLFTIFPHHITCGVLENGFELFMPSAERTQYNQLSHCRIGNGSGSSCGVAILRSTRWWFISLLAKQFGHAKWCAVGVERKNYTLICSSSSLLPEHNIVCVSVCLPLPDPVYASDYTFCAAD